MRPAAGVAADAYARRRKRRPAALASLGEGGAEMPDAPLQDAAHASVEAALPRRPLFRAPAAPGRPSDVYPRDVLPQGLAPEYVPFRLPDKACF